MDDEYRISELYILINCIILLITPVVLFGLLDTITKGSFEYIYTYIPIIIFLWIMSSIYIWSLYYSRLYIDDIARYIGNGKIIIGIKWEEIKEVKYNSTRRTIVIYNKDNKKYWYNSSIINYKKFCLRIDYYINRKKIDCVMNLNFIEMIERIKKDS